VPSHVQEGCHFRDLTKGARILDLEPDRLAGASALVTTIRHLSGIRHLVGRSMIVSRDSNIAGKPTDLLEGFARLAANGEEPALRSEPDIFDGVPEILTKRGIVQKAPVFGFAQKAVSANRLAGIGRLIDLCVGDGNRRGQYEYSQKSGSHADYFPGLAEWISAM